MKKANTLAIGTYELEIKDIIVRHRLVNDEYQFSGIELTFPDVKPVFLRYFEQNNDQLDNLMTQLDIEEFDESDANALKEHIGKFICLKVYESNKIDPITGRPYLNISYNPRLKLQV